MDEDDSPFSINVARPPVDDLVTLALIKQAIELALRRCGRESADISVVIVNDAQIAELNERYLGHSGPTDCISFDLSDTGVEAVEGEIVVSYETAACEAQARGHGVEEEILLYVVHGALHLAGLDDDTESSAQRMHVIEDQVLQAMGIGPVYAP